MAREPGSLSGRSTKTRQNFVERAWFFIFIPFIVLVVFWAQYQSSTVLILPTPTTSPQLQDLTPSPQPHQETAIVQPTPLPTLQEDIPELPSPSPYPASTKELIRAHLSYYWPPFGDMNCDTECEHIATGEDWHDWIGKGVACPKEFPLGTLFVVMGDTWQCIDRGNAIVVNSDGSIWLDFLNLGMPYPIAWGSIRTVEVRRPDQ